MNPLLLILLGLGILSVILLGFQISNSYKSLKNRINNLFPSLDNLFANSIKNNKKNG